LKIIPVRLSSKPDEDARKKDHREKRGGEFLIPRGHTPASLDAAEELLNQEARPEEMAVVRTRHAPAPTGWNYSLRALCFDLCDHRIRIVALVAKDECAR
jgi:hypothetical protein